MSTEKVCKGSKGLLNLLINLPVVEERREPSPKRGEVLKGELKQKRIRYFFYKRKFFNPDTNDCFICYVVILEGQSNYQKALFSWLKRILGYPMGSSREGNKVKAWWNAKKIEEAIAI